MHHHALHADAAAAATPWPAWPAGSWEFAAVLAFAALATADRRAWRARPAPMAAAALLLVVGMHPALDSMARHSVWLHCLQSVLIHHAAPLLLALAGACLPAPRQGRSTRLLASAPGAWTIALCFAGMGWMWLLPGLHLQLMEDAMLYSAMKWGMAINGLLLCQVSLGRYLAWECGASRYWLFSLALALPQAAVGLFLMAS